MNEKTRQAAPGKGRGTAQTGRVAAIVLAALAMAQVAPAVAATWSTGPLDLQIPDASLEGLTTTLTATDDVTLADLTVSIAIDHSFVGDFFITLTNPSGVTRTLLDRPGIPPSIDFGDSSDLSREYPIRFNDLFETPANQAGNPDEECEAFDVIGRDCAGDFAPEEAMLVAWGGQSVAGEWTLTVADHLFLADGVLAWWSLDINPTAVPLPGALWLLLGALSTLRRPRAQ